MKAKRFKSVLLCAAALQAVVGGGQPVTKIAGGLYHSLFLKSDGSLLDVGCEANGEWGCNRFKRSN
jgi:alpha-tubulin suppressor-like RCC1 family protein